MHRPLVLLLLAFMSWPIVADTRVIVAVNHSPPYRILNDDGVSGFYVEVFNALADHLGWTVQYRQAPFRRVLWMLENGQADIMLGALPTPEREAYMDFSIPAFPAEAKHFFYIEPDNRVSAYSDLQDRVIGVLRGSSYSPEFDKDPSLIREPAKSYPILMGMLVAQRIDLVVAPETAGRYTATRVSDNIRVAPFQLTGGESYIAISHHSDIMDKREELQKALQALLESGTFQSIHHRYTHRE